MAGNISVKGLMVTVPPVNYNHQPTQQKAEQREAHPMQQHAWGRMGHRP